MGIIKFVAPPVVQVKAGLAQKQKRIESIIGRNAVAI